MTENEQASGESESDAIKTMKALARGTIKAFEAEQKRREEAELAHQCSQATLAMTVARLAGTVEGAPTHRGNFLQRIDELRRIEAGAAEASAPGWTYCPGQPPEPGIYEVSLTTAIGRPGHGQRSPEGSISEAWWDGPNAGWSWPEIYAWRPRANRAAPLTQEALEYLQGQEGRA